MLNARTSKRFGGGGGGWAARWQDGASDARGRAARGDGHHGQCGDGLVLSGEARYPHPDLFILRGDGACGVLFISQRASGGGDRRGLRGGGLIFVVFAEWSVSGRGRRDVQSGGA